MGWVECTCLERGVWVCEVIVFVHVGYLWGSALYYVGVGLYCSWLLVVLD